MRMSRVAVTEHITVRPDFANDSGTIEFRSSSTARCQSILTVPSARQSQPAGSV